MTVALVVATAATRDRARGPANGAPPATRAPRRAETSGDPAAATLPVAAGLPLAGLRGGEVTTQPLLTRLCGQFGALGVTDIVVLVPRSQADLLTAMAWDGLSLSGGRSASFGAPGAPLGAEQAATGNINVIECDNVGDELRAAAAVARRAAVAGSGLFVCAGDVVAHTEALARACDSAGTVALTAAQDTTDAAAGPDLRPALRLSGSDLPGRGWYTRAGGTPRGVRRDARHRIVVAAGSSFHRVHAPNAVGCGAVKVSARDLAKLAAAADEFALLTSFEAPPLAADKPQAAPTPAQLRQQSRFTDTMSLLLVGLVRSGAAVEAIAVAPLTCRRVQTAQQARAAAAELSAANEDKVRLDAAARPSGLVATFFVNPYAKHLARWAYRRRLTPNALTGMSMGCGLLAALWFSAGTRAGAILGAVLAFAGLVFGCADGQLARYGRQQTAFGAWLDAVGGKLTEYAIYVGLAVGAARVFGAGGMIGATPPVTAITSTSPLWRSLWALAAAIVIVSSFGDMVGICARAVAQPGAPQPGSLPHTALQEALPQPPLDEPADFAVPSPGGVSLEDAGRAGNGSYDAQRNETGYGTAEYEASAFDGTYGSPAGNRTAPAGAELGRSSRRLAVRLRRMAVRLRVATRACLHWLAEIISFRSGERILAIGVTVIVAGARMTFLVLLGWSAAAAILAVFRYWRAARHAPAQSADTASLVGLRDDGILAQALGRFVNGQLPPLLPAAVAVTVTLILSFAGIARLSGLIVLAPVVVMALAALGSGHPHSGSLDWLVPPLLELGENVFLVALGLGWHVPPPLIFALICILAAHHYDVAYRQRGGGPAAPPHWLATAGLGWEGRMLAVALGATLRMEVFAFGALTVYLLVLFGWESLTAWVGATHLPSRITPTAIGGAVRVTARSADSKHGGR